MTDTPEGPPDSKALAVAVEGSRSLAETVARDTSKAEELAEAARRKAERNRGPLEKVWRYLLALIRLLKAYSRREYSSIPWGSIVLVTVALLYFVSPIDLLPDFFLGGLVDDAALIALIVRQIQTDLDAFIAWEVREDQEEAS